MLEGLLLDRGLYRPRSLDSARMYNYIGAFADLESKSSARSSMDVEARMYPGLILCIYQEVVWGGYGCKVIRADLNCRIVIGVLEGSVVVLAECSRVLRSAAARF